MTESQDTRTKGDARLAISNALVGLYRQRYGRGPTQAKTYMIDDLVVCVMRGGGIPVERTLMDGGRGELVAEVRQAFQEEESGAFVRVVEEATERKVLNFLSKHDPVDEVSVEVFILEPQQGE
jgi:uncharacterized protein YbcI